MPRVAAPAALRLAKGVRPGRDSGDRKVKLPPAFKRIPPEPPYQLSDYAEDVWYRVVPELNRLELLKPIDGEQLAAYCEMAATFREAMLAVRSDGFNLTREVRDADPQVFSNPAVNAMMKASSEMRAWAVQFGLTPSSENNLTPAKPDDDDVTAAYA